MLQEDRRACRSTTVSLSTEASASEMALSTGPISLLPTPTVAPSGFAARAAICARETSASAARHQREKFLRPLDAAQGIAADGDQVVSLCNRCRCDEVGRHQDIAVRRMAHGGNTADLVDRGPVEGEIKPVLAADVAVENVADVEAEIDLGHGPAFDLAL